MGALSLCTEGTYPHTRKWQGCGYDFTIWANEKMILLFRRKRENDFTILAGRGNDFTIQNEVRLISY